MRGQLSEVEVAQENLEKLACSKQERREFLQLLPKPRTPFALMKGGYCNRIMFVRPKYAVRLLLLLC